MLWVLGLVLSFCGLFVWLELGTMIPRSGGEKVYLEAVYRCPKNLTTIVYATIMILINLSSGNCLVCPFASLFYSASRVNNFPQVFAEKCFYCVSLVPVI